MSNDIVSFLFRCIEGYRIEKERYNRGCPTEKKNYYVSKGTVSNGSKKNEGVSSGSRMVGYRIKAAAPVGCTCFPGGSGAVDFSGLGVKGYLDRSPATAKVGSTQGRGEGGCSLFLCTIEWCAYLVVYYLLAFHSLLSSRASIDTIYQVLPHVYRSTGPPPPAPPSPPCPLPPLSP